MEIQSKEGFHWVDIWHHQEAEVKIVLKRSYVHLELDPFDQSSLGTNNEGQVTCIAEFKKVLTCSLLGNQLAIQFRLAIACLPTPNRPLHLPN